MTGVHHVFAGYAKHFLLTTQTNLSFNAGKLIFATGIKDMMLDIKGFAECWRISVFFIKDNFDNREKLYQREYCRQT